MYILSIISLLSSLKFYSDAQNMYLETEMNKMEVCPHFAEREKKEEWEKRREKRRTRDENKTSNNAR